MRKNEVSSAYLRYPQKEPQKEAKKNKPDGEANIVVSSGRSPEDEANFFAIRPSSPPPVSLILSLPGAVVIGTCVPLPRLHPQSPNVSFSAAQGKSNIKTAR